MLRNVSGIGRREGGEGEGERERKRERKREGGKKMTFINQRCSF